MKKFLLTSLSFVMVIAMSIGGTMAYLTSEDSDVNVMTMGNVKIEQHEYERVEKEDGSFEKGKEGTDFKEDYGIKESYKLQEFTQDKPAYPAVYTNGGMAWDDFQQLWNQVGAPGSNELFDDSMKNVIDKFVFVENTGKSEVYYRTIIAIESPEGITEKAIHTSFNTNSRFDYNADMEGVQNAANSNKFYTTIEGVRYLVYVATYTDILTPNEVSRPSLLQLYLDPLVTNEDCEKFGDTWEVRVLSQAIQSAGFEDAHTALNEGFGVVNEENVQKWLKDLRIKVDVKGNTKEALATAIEKAPEGSVVVLTEDIDFENSTFTIDKNIVLDLNGKTITSSARNGVFYAKGGCSIKNGTIKHKGTVAGIKVWQAEAIEDVKIVLEGKSGSGYIITGISVQSGTDTYIKSLKNVTITTTGENKTYNGIETYNCGNREDYAIGSMENVKVDVNGTALVLSAPAGTATNCKFIGDVYGINAHLKGDYNVSLNLVDCTVSSIYAWDEPATNPGYLKLTAENTTVTDDVKIEQSEDFGDRWVVTGFDE